MLGKLVMYGAVGLLAVSLVGGTVYILARPETEKTAQTEHVADASGGGSQGQDAGNRSGEASSGSAEPRSGRSGESAGIGMDSNKGKGSAEVGSGMDAAPLAVEEVPGVVSLLEEEKLARDVYLALYREWGYEAFGNISESEQSHMEALIGVLDRAGVADPTAGYGAGEFATAAVQDLYAAFVERGGESLAAALQAGAAIEEMDILDIERLQAQVEAPGLLRVLENLRQGSIRHLQAYSKAYEQESGIAYTPQYLSQEAFDLLMSGPGRGNGGGPGGGGKGNGGFPG
jgi:hypothetical protein